MALHIAPRPYLMLGPGPYPPHFDGYTLSSVEVERLCKAYPVHSIASRKLTLQGLDGLYTIQPLTHGGTAFVHVKQRHGRCPICHHYGSDCTSRRQEVEERKT